MWLTQEIRERRANRARRALTRAVWRLPAESRLAMLGALQAEDIIVGAYTDRRGRICPALAAYRRGARCGVGDFPRAWDDFGRARRPRLATERELEILRAVLEESLPPLAAVEPAVPTVAPQAVKV